MATARIANATASYRGATNQLGHALHAPLARCIEALRRRHERRRMLLAVQDLGHPGVLADATSAAAQEQQGWRLRATRP